MSSDFDFKKQVKKIPYLGKIKKISQSYRIEVYLVGGFLRDLILQGGPSKLDFDFAVEKNAMKFAKDFAAVCKGRLVVLDKDLRNIRVVLRKKNKILNYDFAKFRDEKLRGDLKKRDFTVNTLVVDIKKHPHIELEDHCGGIKDIKKKKLNCVCKNSFKNDPLRILRAFSLSALYGLKITRQTREIIEKHRAKLRHTAPERITEEIFKIFFVSKSYKKIVKMDELGVLERIFPKIKKAKGVHQGGYHHLDVWAHSVETLKCFESLCSRKLKNHPDILFYLSERVGQNRTRAQLIKFSCLFHDIGKPKAKQKKQKRTIFYGHETTGRDIVLQICKKLRLSSKETNFIKKLVFMHLRPGYLADTKRPTQRAVYRYFRDSGEDAVSILLLSLSDWRATRGPLISEKRRRSHERIMLSLIDEYFQRKKRKPLKKLITGVDVMKKIKIGPGPLVGKILAEIREQQEMGKVKTKKQVLELAGQIYKKQQ